MAKIDLTNSSNLFKINYGPISQNQYNSANVILGRVKKKYDFTGKQRMFPAPMGFSGGVGSGSLPTANYQNVEDVVYSAKKVYGRCNVDREALKASNDDKGSFVRLTKTRVKNTIDSYMRNMSRILFNDGTGALGAGDGATNVTGNGSVATPYLVKIGASPVFKEANWEEQDFVNYDAETTNLEVVAVNPTTRVISLVGTSAGLATLVAAPGPVLTTKYFYMQGSKDTDPQGLKGVCDATTSTLYTVTVGRRWQAYQKAAASAALSEDIINELGLETERKCGVFPELFVTSYKQFRKFMNTHEDKKVYELGPRYGSDELKARVRFKGIEIITPAGPRPLYCDRFVEDDRLYALNPDEIYMDHRPDFGWFDDDGTVFMRVANSDEYEARYGGYLEVFINPQFQGVCTGLA